jgi:hypothetical protein
MATNIVKASEHAVVIGYHNCALAYRIEGDVVAGVAQFTDVSGQHPVLPEQA